MAYFDDFVVGYEEVSQELVVDAEEMVAYAHVNDPWPIHVDAAFAETSVHGGLIASFGYVVSLFFRMMHTLEVNQGQQPGFLGGLSWDVQFRRAVRANDVLRVRINIVSKRLTSKGDRGIVQTKCDVLNQDDDVTVEIVVTSMYLCAPQA
jgi:acyl dehydratase